MNERLKQLRKHLNLNQDEFGRRIGVTKTAVSKMELGTYSITDSMVKLVCAEFNINEEWLRLGYGDMFKNFPEEDEVAAYVSELLEDDGSNPVYTLIKEIMHTYSELDAKSQEVLKNSCEKLIENLSKKKEG